MIDAVLATDMDVHSSLQKELVQRGARVSLGSSSDGYDIASSNTTHAFDMTSNSERLMLLKCVLHAADISNPTRRFNDSSRLSLQIFEEFERQTADEQTLGVPVTAHMVMPTFESKCRGEVGFIRFVARPYFVALAACFPDSKAAETWLPAIDSNIAAWERDPNLIHEEAAFGPRLSPLRSRE